MASSTSYSFFPFVYYTLSLYDYYHDYHLVSTLSLLQLKTIATQYTQLAGGKDDHRRKKKQTNKTNQDGMNLSENTFFFGLFWGERERFLLLLLDDDVYSIFILSSFRHGPSSKTTNYLCTIE